MKNISILLVISLCCFNFLFSQTSEYKITKLIPATGVKNQALSGTCWSFATTSFIESELLRISKKEYDLSEMFTVRNIYKEKVNTNIRMQGYNFLTQGGQAHNVLYILRNLGAVPEKVYTGKVSGETSFNHYKLAEIIKSVVKDNKSNTIKGIDSSLLNKTDSILDYYIGKLPENFEYKGNTYTPKSFVKEKLKINPDDYIELTSYTHKAYYKSYSIKDKFNWAQEQYMNIPLSEFCEVADYALNNGFSVNWNGDVSEKTFDFASGTASLHIDNAKANVQLRQKMYDSQETTIDHLMHIIGTAVNKKGEKFYYVKNSWGKGNTYNGYMFMSESYFKLKTVSITVHKNAVPEKIFKKIRKR